MGPLNFPKSTWPINHKTHGLFTNPQAIDWCLDTIVFHIWTISFVNWPSIRPHLSVVIVFFSPQRSPHKWFSPWLYELQIFFFRICCGGTLSQSSLALLLLLLQLNNLWCCYVIIFHWNEWMKWYLSVCFCLCDRHMHFWSKFYPVPNLLNKYRIFTSLHNGSISCFWNQSN